jgi:hypothetical protein
MRCAYAPYGISAVDPTRPFAAGTPINVVDPEALARR